MLRLVLCDLALSLLPDYGLHVHPFIFNSFVSVTFLGAAQPPPDDYDVWWPRWMVQASERLDALAGHGCPADAAVSLLRRAIHARSHDGYGQYAAAFVTALEDEARPSVCSAVPTELLEELRAWVLYTEENCLIDFLEGNYPSSTRALWAHLASGGTFQDVLPAVGDMIHEDVFSFNTLRLWNPVLSELLPRAGVPRREEPRWVQITAQWVDDVVVELRQLMQTGWCGLAALQSLQSSARQRGDQAYAAVVTTLLDVIRAELHLGLGPCLAVCPDSWAETHEGKLFAFYVQLQGGMEASSSTAARLIPISTIESDDDCMSLVQHFEMAEDPSVANAFKVTSTEDDAYELGGDVISLVTHGVKKQWLKSEAKAKAVKEEVTPMDRPWEPRPWGSTTTCTTGTPAPASGDEGNPQLGPVRC